MAIVLMPTLGSVQVNIVALFNLNGGVVLVTLALDEGICSP